MFHLRACDTVRRIEDCSQAPQLLLYHLLVSACGSCCWHLVLLEWMPISRESYWKRHLVVDALFLVLLMVCRSYLGEPCMLHHMLRKVFTQFIDQANIVLVLQTCFLCYFEQCEDEGQIFQCCIIKHVSMFCFVFNVALSEYIWHFAARGRFLFQRVY